MPCRRRTLIYERLDGRRRAFYQFETASSPQSLILMLTGFSKTPEI
ncbi:hypothetical protein [Enterobacter bugandensis]|nr:hypothetical protein [Enterobacter bugandensis]